MEPQNIVDDINNEKPAPQEKELHSIKAIFQSFKRKKVDLKACLSNIEKQLQEQHEEIQLLNQHIHSKDDTIKTILEDKTKLSAELFKLEGEYYKILNDLDTKLNAISTLNEEKTELMKKINTLKLQNISLSEKLNDTPKSYKDKDLASLITALKEYSSQ